jgi:hypothetical protein
VTDGVETFGDVVPGTYPPQELLGRMGYHWLHAERAGEASIAQWAGDGWIAVGEKSVISPRDMLRRGWEYLGPCARRPISKYLDR